MNEVQQYIGLYVTDKIRLTPQLSANIGLRWEPYLPVHDINGRATHFDMTAFLAGTKSTVFPSALRPGRGLAKKRAAGLQPHR